MTSMFKKPKVKTQAQGFNSMPQGYQDLFNTITGNINSGLSGINQQMFDPSQGVTAGAFSNLMQGFSPTESSITSDMNMLMNPYNDSVINLINREAQGENSILNQSLNRTGQMGSNRAILGANDIEQNRLNNIGAMQQGQYNTALNQVLNSIIPQRQQDTMNQLTVGQQSTQSPLAALMAQGGLLSQLPTQFGTQAAAQSSGGGTDWGKVAGFGLSLFSDENLKENIKHVGGKNGLRLYEFNYKPENPLGLPSDKKYIGVIAQEVQEKRPDAVSVIDGFLAVDYDKIGIEMKEVA